jgi:hypothetical protein
MTDFTVWNQAGEELGTVTLEDETDDETTLELLIESGYLDGGAGDYEIESNPLAGFERLTVWDIDRDTLALELESVQEEDDDADSD